jgi:large subunit ribosomal protein L31
LETCAVLKPPPEGEAAVKSGTHPEYKKATITCACGHAIDTYSTAGDYSIDVCSACHPFFTGKQKLLDTAGRVDRFRRKYANITR